MLLKRIIVCLDVRDGRTTKGIQFCDNVDVGDPVEMAKKYYAEGADEIVFYDITASFEQRTLMRKVLEKVAKDIFIPIAVGGGISTVDEVRAILLSGAEKVSLNSQAVRNPMLIAHTAARFGQQCVVLGMDAKRDVGMPSGYRVFIDGGRVPTELDALAWAKKAELLGAGEIVVNSIDADGRKGGYELTLTKNISESVGIPVVASGGAGSATHLLEVFKEASADAALVASLVHYGILSIAEIKKYLTERDIPVRMMSRH